jgi:hypothetical protein
VESIDAKWLPFNPRQRRRLQKDSERAKKGQPVTDSASLGQFGPCWVPGKMWDCKTSKMSQSPHAALNAFGLFAQGLGRHHAGARKGYLTTSTFGRLWRREVYCGSHTLVVVTRSQSGTIP